MNNELLNIISNFRSFDWTRDLIDVVIIAIGFYVLIVFARKSRAGQLVKGLLLLLAFYAVAYYFRLRTVRWVLSNVMQIGFIAVVVLFQPEIRRTLERLGQSTSWAGKIFFTRKMEPTLRGRWQSAIVAICDAAEQLSDTRTGALMIRLFANMMGGHIMLYIMAAMTAIVGWYAFPTVLVASLLYFFELFVACLQAYVFTMLAAVFIGMMVHPQH